MKNMNRIGIIAVLMFFLACKSSDQQTGTDDESSDFNFSAFSERFKETDLPYQLTDSGLLQNKDTNAIRNIYFSNFIPDSIKVKLTGASEKIIYVPMASFKGTKNERFFVLKASSGAKKSALVVVFDKNNNYSAAFPLLVPDSDNKTNQSSSIDKSMAITRMVTRKRTDDVMAEGRDVYTYDAASKRFTLIMTDLLDDSNQELINPIDTFARSHRYSGDYIKDKRNMVSIRDGRNENEIHFFLHFERMDGQCNGELKGTAFFASSKTAVYRQSGDPCVLEFHFSNNSITLKEVEGCGSYRGIQCVIEGSFSRKKQTIEKKADKAK
jgi:hypothetical protein